MSYQLTPGEKELPAAVAWLKSRSDVAGKCLLYCRLALATQGLRLPSAADIIAHYGHSTAIGCYHILAADPGKYGWQLVSGPQGVHPIVLAVFKDCGEEDGVYCGHIALWDQADGILYSSKDYPASPYFLDRIAGIFIPL